MTRKLLLQSAFAALMTATATLSTAQAGQPAYPPWGLDLSWMDKSVKPGNDFFLYGNGGWAKTATIPADRSYSGVNLEVDLANEKRLKGIVADLQAKTDAQITPEQRKLRDFYHAFTDQKAIEAAGLKPAEKDLATIAAVKTQADVARLMGDPALGLSGPFGLYISTDDKHPNAYAIRLYQSGLGLPDRDYYLKDDPALATTRAAYKKFIATMLGLLGDKDAAARAEKVYSLEHDIAVVHWAAADRRDAEKTYNPMTIAALKQMAPQFPWDAFFTAANVPEAGGRSVIVTENTAFPKLAKVFATVPMAVWRDYLTVSYLNTFAAYLPKRFDDADFDFYGKVIRGNTQQLDRATRGIHLLDGDMGEALGKLYTDKYFPPAAKAKAKLLVDNLLKAYEIDIKSLDWMTPATRAKALDKLHHYMLKIGYPDHWRDYSALAIVPGDLVQDVKNATLFEWNREMARIDKPVVRTEWEMTPPTNNAYYDPSLNEIVFPAGILQPPFFDPNADDAVNYGEIGATIGHEISHGFDDQGSKYDGSGKLANWWTETDRKNFDARTTALAKQYDAYEPIKGTHINGKLTLGENIADLAGLVIAYKAYHIALAGHPAPVLNGMTGDQRFYNAYSQSWRQKDREASLRRALLSNPHSPANYRVNGVVRNDDGWYASFPDIKPGDAYYLAPDKRVHLW